MSTARGPRDALVTGMGFCLPGPDGMTATTQQFWDVIAGGKSFLKQDDGCYFGNVSIVEKDIQEKLPEIPERYLEKYSDLHFYGLLALLEACADAGFDWRAGDLTDAALLVARNGSADLVLDSYLPVLLADTERTTPQQARALLFRNVLNAVLSDVEATQAGLLRTTGPSYTLSCGCASSSVLLGNAARMIVAGEADIVLVTGADYWRYDRLRQYAALEERSVTSLEPQTATLVDEPMRPYDERAAGLNYGNGAVTMIVESREHAERRGRGGYGRIFGQSTSRNAQSNLAIDGKGTAAVRAARLCMEGRVTPDEIDYVNGGATGDRAFNAMEAEIISTLFGERSAGLPVTVQEGCFGHSGAPLGNIGVAATLLMMNHGQVAPTANCEIPAALCTFDPVPGHRTAPLRIERALSLNYTIGSVASAILLGGADA
ncbi:beta-ketoacyl synthase N-terminal-like domain-containing protein [Streptomyces sp. H27-D2]|uniref:beta-ketoacyl synthase N-terminal-like domain-containing protein n=1 Tax=Streptomyces sp. H27-D2 TaxID=3046304 RepID=UPI002DB77C6D|nr:beta-ketoacyl synthase N-terminal-like domain-containing protein [Streptomyces sp. H27-D2]MEC4019146.1 beta-ketoacyl synthase N-terminal-like domain-containing protein [Streptomyces sp. H27-D2]